MPVIWAVEPDLVVLTIIGSPSTEGIRDAGAAAVGCPRFRRGRPLVVER